MLPPTCAQPPPIPPGASADPCPHHSGVARCACMCAHSTAHPPPPPAHSTAHPPGPPGTPAPAPDGTCGGRDAGGVILVGVAAAIGVVAVNVLQAPTETLETVGTRASPAASKGGATCAGATQQAVSSSLHARPAATAGRVARAVRPAPVLAASCPADAAALLACLAAGGHCFRWRCAVRHCRPPVQQLVRGGAWAEASWHAASSQRKPKAGTPERPSVRAHWQHDALPPTRTQRQQCAPLRVIGLCNLVVSLLRRPPTLAASPSRPRSSQPCS